MSATLRYDIGVGAGEVLFSRGAEPDPFAPLGARRVLRWKGCQFGHAYVYTFAVKLPGHAALAVALASQARTLSGDGSSSWVAADGGTRNSCRALARNLTLSLGLPAGDVSPDERAFLDALAEDPGGLSRWAVYADWLLEGHAGEGQAWRGRLIQGWLGADRIKVKYGIPVIARVHGLGRKWEE